MKILQLISSLGYFGAENVLVQLANELHKDSSCEVIAGIIENLGSPHVEVASECSKRGITSVCFPCSRKIDLKTILNLRQYIKDSNIDIIHSHGYKSNLYSFFSTFGLRVGLIATCHNWIEQSPKMKVYSVLDRIFLKRFAHIVAVSDEVQNTLSRNNIPPRKVSIIKNGIDLERFNNIDASLLLRKDLAIPDHHVVIGTVGRISKEKGHIHLLRVFKALKKQLPETTLLIIGSGQLKDELQAEFSDQSIIFTGLRNDIPELYQAMDIFVLPSLTEGLPMVLLEAMSSRLPVVATNVGQIPFVIKENDTGLMVPPGDEKELERNLLKLALDQETRKSMGVNGYARVKESFSSVRMTQEYKNIYQTVLGRAQ
ncbi:glycosyltransferase family 4 protein [Desulfopila sp. IMCC35008]|uniref:glycosyltransferase family 4 protein n=1 Tax=Desulfopila sp. IMCC35008 TaxID=2653858 RepID=UPI0013CF4F3C|nr:glycosyltransferase family 4 protein [Desulfopila sp. IMCC35008]